MERLIAAVRQYPCLWNTGAIEYRDHELKDAAWRQVLADTDLASVKEVKLKWKKLRDSYRDALKRQNDMLAKESGNPGKRTYPWKYSALMQFLQPYMSNRKKPPESPRHAAGGACAANGHADTRSDSDSDSEPESEPKRKAIERAGPGGPSTALPGPPVDPLDTFFESMCQSTKRFPFAAQIRIKKTLFAAVIEAEETLLAEQQQSYASLWAAPASPSSSDAPHDRGDDDDDRK